MVHICLQGLVLIGLTFLAAGFRYFGTAIRWLLIAGLALDFSLGILLHVSLENLDYMDKVPQTDDPIAFSLAQAAPSRTSEPSSRPLNGSMQRRQSQADGDPLLADPLPLLGRPVRRTAARAAMLFWSPCSSALSGSR